MSQPTQTRRTAPRPLISAEESECRRLLVRDADHENLLEGITRDPATDPIFEAFICGEIEVADLIPRLRALLIGR